MNCPKAKILSPYLDDRLSPAERSRYEDHMTACPVCRERLRGLEALKAGFSRPDRNNAPPWFSARVMAAVARSETRPIFPFPAVVRFGEALVVLIMITVGVVSGGFLVMEPGKHAGSNLASSLSLEVFDAAPSDSIGGVYLALTGSGHGQ